MPFGLPRIVSSREGGRLAAGDLARRLKRGDPVRSRSLDLDLDVDVDLILILYLDMSMSISLAI